MKNRCLAACMALASVTAHADEKALYDYLNTDLQACTLDLEYVTAGPSIRSRTERIAPFPKKAETLRDGYATIPVRFKLHGIRATQFTLPASGQAFQQYTLRLDAGPDKVKRVLEKAWGVKFAFNGPDGMDDSMGVSYRVVGAGEHRIRLLAVTAKAVNTYLECEPLSAKAN